MNILVTNDDGFGAPGLIAISKALSKKHNVYVIAPSGNRSGKGMSVHIASPLAYSRFDDHHFTCSGNPVDCVIAGTRTNIVPCDIDLVVSGINKGPNMGTDIVYSGTCSAAVQATVFGIPAIAVSMNMTNPELEWEDDFNWDYGPLATFVSDNLDTLISLARPSLDADGNAQQSSGVFVNINAFDKLPYKGVKQTGCCFMKHDGRSKVDLTDDNKGDFTSVFWGVNAIAVRKEDSDYEACEQGYIALSRVTVDPFTEPADLSNITWTL